MDKNVLAAMTQTIQHRGPDDRGILMTGSVGLGHTRLSIIDLTPAGHQPMQSTDGRVSLVYNGEVYNFGELRRELEKEGAVFHSRSDTEVVLQAYQYWGVDAFQRFNGMFALAIWDQRNETLYLARDRFGIKPLYYHPFASGMVFGSEIKALLASGRVPRRINWAALHEYLYYGNALGDRTLFDSIAKVIPGHYITVNQSGCTSTSYWQVDDIMPVNSGEDEAVATVRELLDRAVCRHLVSDVPVGIFLSGGIDSSCVTALATRHSQGRLQTFSVGFDFDQGINELAKARQVAEQYGTEHHELYIQGYSLPRVIERLVTCHDEPFGDAANIPLYLLCEKLAGSPKVILQGDGGDEIFAGYRRYNALAAYPFWRIAAPVAQWANMFTPKNPGHYRRRRFFRAVGNRDPALRMALLLTMEMPEQPLDIMSPGCRQVLTPHDPFAQYREYDARLRHLDAVQRMLYTDTSVLLPNTFLEKVDKATMAHGIEVRVPLLDHDLTDYVMGLPSAYKVRWGRKKWLLRQALRGIVSDAILDAPKTGFGVPYSNWLRKPLANYLRSVLFDPAVVNTSLFDHHNLQICLDEHVAGQRDHGFLLWKALHLALWHHNYGLS